MTFCRGRARRSEEALAVVSVTEKAVNADLVLRGVLSLVLLPPAPQAWSSPHRTSTGPSPGVSVFVLIISPVASRRDPYSQ